MQRFRKIMVVIDSNGTDDAPNSLLRAVKLARNTGAEIHVVGVIPQLRSFLRSWLGSDLAAEELALRRLENRICEMCEEYAAGVEYSYAVLTGRPYVELIKEANKNACDLIVKTADQHDGFQLLGSGDCRLMRNSSLPVWIVKTKPVPIYERVLVAVDPFAETDEEVAVNNRLLELANSLAEWENGQLHVVAACEIRGAELLVSSMSPAQFDEHVTELAGKGKEALRQMIKSLPNPVSDDRIEYQQGTPASVIVDYAHSIDADVVVMGTLTKSNIESMLIGNTAEEVLSRVRNSVLTIKPSGFDSPVLP